MCIKLSKCNKLRFFRTTKFYYQVKDNFRVYSVLSNNLAKLTKRLLEEGALWCCILYVLNHQ